MEVDAQPFVSGEHRVHREVYKKSRYLLIVHAHPPFAVAVSILSLHEIIPKDSKCVMSCSFISVVKGDYGTDELTEMLFLVWRVRLL
jgi:L-fuculose-phosphate aldolase